MFSNRSKGLVPVLLSFISFISLISCSVKEDRSGCPFVLTIDLREALKKAPSELLPFRISLYGGDICTEVLTDSAFWQCSLPRDSLSVRVAAVEDSGALTEGGLKIAEGNDCPSIYWSIDKIESPGESVTIVPHLKKDFCRLSVSFIGSPPGTLPYDVRFLGNICGYDSSTKPSPGPFCFTCRETGPGTSGGHASCVVKLPRQKDGSLKMDILSGDTILRSFAIGHYMESCGYDWTSEDLEDLELEINFAATTITLRTAAWTVVSYFEVMI